MAAEHSVDIRHGEQVRVALAQTRPEVVFHLAAQPMVRRSLVEPALTYEVNVMGTVNVLDAVRLAGEDVRAVVVVTSDKCYENRPTAGSPDSAGREEQTAIRLPDSAGGEGRAPTGSPGSAGGEHQAATESPDSHGRAGRPFREGDPLGGDDPYSSSKACAEIVSAAYVRSFFRGQEAPGLATARAGNVIGGGDWGEDRLLPDAVRVASGIALPPLRVRNPNAVRPWQPVLNPLLGYLMLAQALCDSPSARGSWNFGPDAKDARPVRWVLERLQQCWGGRPAWDIDGAPNPPEADRLELDSTQAQTRLGWRPVWDLSRGLRELVRWHDGHAAGEDMRDFSVAQLESFLCDADGGNEPAHMPQMPPS
jgi:CDP-glucose 4,6-dehydratase